MLNTSLSFWGKDSKDLNSNDPQKNINHRVSDTLRKNHRLFSVLS